VQQLAVSPCRARPSSRATQLSQRQSRCCRSWTGACARVPHVRAAPVVGERRPHEQRHARPGPLPRHLSALRPVVHAVPILCGSPCKWRAPRASMELINDENGRSKSAQCWKQQPTTQPTIPVLDQLHGHIRCAPLARRPTRGWRWRVWQDGPQRATARRHRQSIAH